MKFVKQYNPDLNTVEAARERISILFDNFKDINVSISSGKDSTVLYWLCVQEAQKRGRKITAFFQDQEAEYRQSIELMRIMMNHPNVIPAWYQVPIYLTNSTSYNDTFLNAWGEGEDWIREKEEIAIKEIEGEYSKRFYGFFKWYENRNPQAAYLVGLRADESLTRFRAVTKYDGWNGYKWSTISGKINKFYPIYDMTVYDVWKFIYDYDLPYNKIYDLMFMDNYSVYTNMRVSNLIHEKSYKCLSDLPKYEPDTYNLLCKRISGISTASRYASEKLIFNNKQLPKHYENWEQFRDFLLQNVKNSEHKLKFTNRFTKQPKTEKIYQGQVGQLLISDYENSCPYDTKKAEKTKLIKEKWSKIL